jgi:hypothetical protein
VTVPSAAAVSRALARGGRRPLPSGTPYSRQGLRVKRSASAVAMVVADYDSNVEGRWASADAEQILAAAGFSVARVNPTILRVEGRSA